jgi:hypothetical protein
MFCTDALLYYRKLLQILIKTASAQSINENWWLLLLFAESCGAGEEGQTTCSKCSAGFYKPSAGLVPCMKCSQQYTSNEDRTQDSWSSIFNFMCMFCKSLFVLFLIWPVCCLSFFDLWILITPLVSSNSS